MSRRKTLVLVAYYAPPAVGIAAHRFGAMVRHLRPLGWETVVVAPESVHFHRGESEDVDGAEVVRVPNPEPSRWLRRLVGGPSARDLDASSGSGEVEVLAPATTGFWGGLLRRLVRTWLYIPDAHFPWIEPASRAVQGVLERTSGPTVVYSSSVPFSAHFAAKRAVAGRDVPWVAEYRDPWSAAPPQFGRRPALRQLIDRRLDHSVVTAASRVVVTSEATRSLFLDAFHELRRDHVHVVRNGWEVRVPDSAPSPAESLVLVYNGTLMRWQWAVPLLRAVKRLDKADGVRVRVLGPKEPWRRAARKVGGLDAVLELPGMVPGHEMPQRLAGASAHILLQPEERLRLYVAGKVYEYLGSRRPVVAWTPEDSEMTTLLRAHGDLRLVRSGTTDAFHRVLRELLEEHRSGSLQGPRVPWEVVEPLSRGAQVARLSAVLDDLVRPKLRADASPGP